ncbi:MAG: polyprenol monophosphomannose synthase [Porphyromonas sp.]|nr:polyprenol monophosphomannose synthase [Porphyromonas sp.]
MERSNKVVVIPTYNEIENIRAIILAVMELEEPFDVLVVDDNSPDRTAEEVRKLEVEYPERVHLLLRTKKQGLGTAYIAGFRWALDQGYHYVLEMDADFSHNPKDLVRLYEACSVGGADVAIGSRYVQGVNVVNWPLGRVLMSYFASKYVQLVTGLNVNDATAGFVCYRAEVLFTMELDKVAFKGYGFQIEMKHTAKQCGFELVEVPIVFVNRVLGTSKMNTSIFGEAFFGVFRLRWWSWTRKYPQKGSHRLEEGNNSEHKES